MFCCFKAGSLLSRAFSVAIRLFYLAIFYFTCYCSLMRRCFRRRSRSRENSSSLGLNLIKAEFVLHLINESTDC